MTQRTAEEIRKDLDDRKCYLIKEREYTLFEIYEDKEHKELQAELREVLDDVK